jgi:hypothetical protein
MFDFWILVLVFWLFVGICGYIMMYFCDTATGLPLCAGTFFVLTSRFNSCMAALVFAPIAFMAGLVALSNWKKYTQELRQKLRQRPEPKPSYGKYPM